ncbi:hypothetical protein [Azospirillum sp. TSH64]|uniref:hypothetical protein n=1 Tax=Azospirillum sp. TSH64 TaxID=652740 RepID=UPI000D621CC4|nr:hypothetical protein [Azospirillum sp. TSH64]PWC74502.1 hypothetical protein TSH64_05485 [Azospirillum sp. TSH64]
MMSLGPTLIYDKSLLQSLNQEEAFWLERHFRGVLTPVFLIEVLGDLKKTPRGERTPEAIVGGLAAKVGPLGTFSNIDHHSLVIQDLLGNPVAMTGRPVVRGGRRVRDRTGKIGVVFDEAPEMEALRRWQEGDFEGMEHALAAQWRQAVAEIDLQTTAKSLNFVRSHWREIKTLDDVARIAKTLVDDRGENFKTLKAALDALQIPKELWTKIQQRWREMKCPCLRLFAPYAAHVFAVEMFFLIGLGAELIQTSKKAKTRVDIAYLYYLPFCMAFTSSDDFHRQTVPLFMNEQQRFIHGPELKADLAKLRRHYDGLPDEVQQQGSLTYAAYPPLDGDFLISRLHDELLPGWRMHARNPIRITPELNAKLMDHLRPMLDAINTTENAPR